MAKEKKASKRPILKLIVYLVVGYLALQLARHPEQIVSFIGWSNKKNPSATWQTYKYEFQRHATSIMTPSLLAAIAQVESSGDPLAVQSWTFRFTDRLLNIFSPATTATGLMQFTKGTFERAKKYCIHRGKVESKECLLTSLSSRLIPSDAIEVTAAYLHKEVTELQRKVGVRLGLKDKQRLAAVIHLCGKNVGRRVAKARMKISNSLRCGRHRVATYVNKITRLKSRFAQL